MGAADHLGPARTGRESVPVIGGRPGTPFGPGRRRGSAASAA